nr:response regulator transcription factor [Stakelama sediminis]
MRILVVEDDSATSDLLRDALVARSHRVTIAKNGSEAIQLADDAMFDIGILDCMLPDIGGIDVLREIRRRDVGFPVIMLTALGAINDRVAGLEAGADDYLVKPFAIEELQARLSALYRRPPLESKPTHFLIGDIEIDMLSRQVRVGSKRVHLQPREFDLLAVLAENAGRTVTRSMFLEQVWTIRYDPRTNIVDSHISRLRTKLKSAGSSEPIETIQGVGYRLRHRD